MKRLKTINKIESGDYIKAINNNGKYLIFKATRQFKHQSFALIVDTDISGLETLIGKEEFLSVFSLEREFKLYRLNKFERWLYEI